MTPIMKIWLGLVVISLIIQGVLARKKVSHVKGLILPVLFLLFGIYAWINLRDVGIRVTIRTAFLLPAFFIFGVFEVIYWKNVMEEKNIKVHNMWKGWIFPMGYWILISPFIYKRFLYVNEIRKVPDYYSTATYLFPGVLFLMLYYIVCYYKKQNSN